jgi:hypothetical protein
MVWWIQSVYVALEARRSGVLRALFAAMRREAEREGAAGLRLYVANTNASAQAVYAALGMTGGHYSVLENMFAEPPRIQRGSTTDAVKTCSRCGAMFREAGNRDDACRHHPGRLWDHDRHVLGEGAPGDFWDCCMLQIQGPGVPVPGCTTGRHVERDA